MFSFYIEEFKGSAPCLGQGSQHVPIGCLAEVAKRQKQLQAYVDKFNIYKGVLSLMHREISSILRPMELFRPEAAGEEAAVLSIVPEQAQCEL